MVAIKQTRVTPSREADTALGKRAHMLMWSSNITQGKVAQIIGMSSDSLGRKLKGERGWAVGEVIAIAHVLGTTVAYLVGETENPHPDNPGGGELEPPAGVDPATCSLQGGPSPVIHMHEWRKAS